MAESRISQSAVLGSFEPQIFSSTLGLVIRARCTVVREIAPSGHGFVAILEDGSEVYSDDWSSHGNTYRVGSRVNAE